MEEEPDQFIEQGSLIAVGPEQALVDPAYQGDAEKLGQSAVNEQSEGLKRMPHDKGRLRIVVRLLVEALDCGHFLSFFCDFDAVGDEEQVAVDGHW